MVDYRCVIAAALLLAAPTAAGAQSVPTVDTEDASLGTAQVGPGRLHLLASVDLRNGDFARGGYDDDAANLDRVPAHVQLGLAWDAHRDREGRADLWLVATSSNGFHAPVPAERVRPRAWYESNSLVALVGKPTGSLTLGAVYAIKTSPNGIASTSHETSLTAAIDGDRGLAALHPTAAVTVRPKGGGGVFTQVGIAPELPLGRGEDAPTLSFPLLGGIGWNGFYEEGSGDVAYASGGVAWTWPVRLGTVPARLRADALAIWRDTTLRRIGSLDAETGAVVPLVTLTFSVAY